MSGGAAAGAGPRVVVVIILGGVSKGTRFRPLSLDLPKPLFPLAGMPMIQHHMEACVRQLGSALSQIVLMGSFAHDTFSSFIAKTSSEYAVPVTYLREEKELGTAGGLYRFRNELQASSPDLLFVLHCDLCCLFPVWPMLCFQQTGNYPFVMAGTEVAAAEASLYGNIIADDATNQVLHWAEKPETFVSNIINCGMYLFTKEVFERLVDVHASRQAMATSPRSHASLMDEAVEPEVLRMEKDVLMPLAGSGRLFLFRYSGFWCKISSAEASLRCQELYMGSFREKHQERLGWKGRSGTGPRIVGDVVIHPTAEISASARIGPNVSIGAGVRVGEGARVRDSILLEGVVVKAHACVLRSIIGWNSVIGRWARIEGDGNDDAVRDVTIFGVDVKAGREIVVRNCIVLPHKTLNQSYHNEILL